MIRKNVFEPQGKIDVFSDATPYSGIPVDINHSLSKEELLSIKKELESRVSKGKISSNPTAGGIHRKECTAPWRQRANKEIQLENQKSKEEQKEKRVWGLAKQTHVGLKHSYCINFGIAELATILRLAQKQRILTLEGHVVEEKDLKAEAILVAAEQYDLPKIISILGLKEKGKNT